MYNRFVTKTIQELYAEKCIEYENRTERREVSYNNPIHTNNQNITINIYVQNNDSISNLELLEDIFMCCRI